MLVHAEGAVDSNDGAMDGAGDDERNISEGLPMRAVKTGN